MAVSGSLLMISFDIRLVPAELFSKLLDCILHVLWCDWFGEEAIVVKSVWVCMSERRDEVLVEVNVVVYSYFVMSVEILILFITDFEDISPDFCDNGRFFCRCEEFGIVVFNIVASPFIWGCNSASAGANQSPVQ